MKTRHLINTHSLIASILAMTLSGCIGLKTFPQAARGGDTVALAVGSADGMSRDNTSATFVSDSANNTPINLTPGIRGIFRLYADKTSGIYNPGSTSVNYVVSTSGHEPWVTIMVVDLPQGLPTGPGKVNVTTTAAYPTIGSHINSMPIKLDILPGTGTPSDLPYEFGIGISMPGDLTLMEPAPHAQIMPVFPSSSSWPTYGAIEMKMYVPTSAGTALDPPNLRVVVDDMSVLTSSILNTTFRHDSNQNLTVMLLSPAGKLRYYEPRFSIVLINNSTQAISFAATPVITSVRYFDINGNVAAGPPISSYTVQLR